MTVKQLKNLLEEADDNMNVYIPLNTYFDGNFLKPCVEESGVAELTIDEETGKTEFQFIIVPHHYFEIEEEIDPSLN